MNSIQIDKLTKNNYYLWYRAIKLLLGANGLDHLLLESDPTKDTEKNADLLNDKDTCGAFVYRTGRFRPL
jgi:hypothetical protein